MCSGASTEICDASVPWEGWICQMGQGSHSLMAIASKIQLSNRTALWLDWNKNGNLFFQFIWIFRTTQTPSLNPLLFDNWMLLGIALLYRLCSSTVILQHPFISFFDQPSWKISSNKSYHPYISKLYWCLPHWPVLRIVVWLLLEYHGRERCSNIFYLLLTSIFFILWIRKLLWEGSVVD